MLYGGQLGATELVVRDSCELWAMSTEAEKFPWLEAATKERWVQTQQVGKDSVRYSDL
jgi:hypothetical protein